MSRKRLSFDNWTIQDERIRNNLKRSFPELFMKMWEDHREIEKMDKDMRSLGLTKGEKEFFSSCEILGISISRFYNPSIQGDDSIIEEVNNLFLDPDDEE